MDSEPNSQDPALHAVLESRGPGRPPVLGPQKKGRPWKTIAAAVVTGILALVVITEVSRSHAKRAAAERVAALEGQWAALEGCVLGDALQADESPASRFRAVQLTVVGTPREARAKEHEVAWPVRCSGFASSVAEHADAAHANTLELKTSANALAKDLRADVNGTADLGKLVDQVWKDATGAGLKAKPADPGEAPKPTRALLSDEAFHDPVGFAGDFTMASVKPDPSPTANLRFIIDDRGLKSGPVLCAVSGTPTTLVCSRVGTDEAAGSRALTLVGTTDPGQPPWIFAGDRGQLGIYRPSGSLAMKGEPAWGASVGPDDSAWLLVHPTASPANEMRLLHAPLAGDLPPAYPVVMAPEVASPSDTTLAWDWLVLWSGPHAQFPHHLVAHQVMPATGLVGPAIDIGDAASLEAAGLKDAEPRFTACRSGTNTAVRIHGAHADAVTFYTGTAWTAPVALATHGGTMLCEKNEAVVTQVSLASSATHDVEQSRCNASGCHVSHVSLENILAGTDVSPQPGASFAAAELNGQLMMVWDAGALGGLRMRLATVDRLRTTPDVVIADTHGDAQAKKDNNTVGAVSELGLLSAADAAVLVVRTSDGPHLFSVDGKGKMTGLQTKI